jgi:hypothetical protein
MNQADKKFSIALRGLVEEVRAAGGDVTDILLFLQDETQRLEWLQELQMDWYDDAEMRIIVTDVLNPKPDGRKPGRWGQNLFNAGEVYLLHDSESRLIQVLALYGEPACGEYGKAPQEVLDAIRSASEPIELEKIVQLYDERRAQMLAQD